MILLYLPITLIETAPKTCNPNLQCSYRNCPKYFKKT